MESEFASEAPAAARACRISVLPPALADQIAAGEVVERPASVVKELVENAIDAGARKVEVEIEGGGRKLVRVVDDGGGMTAEEARLALRRHATSKIAAADDLWGLSTFGFRGEALPSIAAVARLTIATRVPEAAVGFRLSVEAGQETDAREAGLPAGTQIEVRDLFFNTPARLKFLKSEATEVANASEAMLRLALAHPEVHLRLRSNGRQTLDLPAHRDRGERVRAALARRGAGLLHEARGEENGVRVHAYLAGPDEAASTARNAFLFVGQRFVRDRSLQAALSMGYGELLERGRFPMAVLFVDVPGREVDINVHPQKLEVRFARAQEVYGAVRHAVAAAVARAPWLVAAPVRAFTLPPSGGREERTPERAAGTRSLPYVAQRPRENASVVDVAPVPQLNDGGPDATAPAHESTGFFARLGFIGQLHRTYLLCESDGELVMVDQHAAHERVAFERLRNAHRSRQVARQRLLFPIPIDVDEALATVGEESGVLAELGFEVERFGPRTLLVRAVPELLAKGDPKPLVLDVLGQLAEGRDPRRVEDAMDHILATLACHCVVRAGDTLSRAEVESLLRQLDGVDLRSHCPHGRPVLLRLPLGEIERRFGRT